MSEFIERYWRDATVEDAIKEPPMVARFRSSRDDTWHIGSLMGLKRENSYPWYSIKLGFHKQCQVYDAPHPGEGWRLIDPNTETLREGDGLMVSSHRESGWVEIQVRPNSWSERDFYRRRIEQPKPKYEPFRWEDRDQLRGRLITYFDRNRTVEFRCESFAVDDGVFSVNHIYADWLCKNAVFIDTKEPVGRRVE